MNDGQVQAPIVSFGLFVSWGDMVGFHHLIALQGFQMNVESPKTMQVLEYLVSRFTQGFTVVLLMTQRTIHNQGSATWSAGPVKAAWTWSWVPGVAA